MTRISRAVSNTVSFSPSRDIETFPHMDLSGGGGGTTVSYDILSGLQCGVARQTQYYDSSIPTTYENNLQRQYDDRKVGLDYSSYNGRYRFYQAFFRFYYIAVPAGSTIDSAFLKVEFHAGTAWTFRVVGFDKDNVSTPSSGYDVRHSLHTTAYVDWTTDSSASFQTSPDIKTIVQEIVDRAGYAADGAMMLGMYMASENYDDHFRTFNTGHDSNDTAPQLEITYS